MLAGFFIGVGAVVFGAFIWGLAARWSIRRCSEPERIQTFAAAVEKAANLYLPDGAIRLTVYQQEDEDEASDSRS